MGGKVGQIIAGSILLVGGVVVGLLTGQWTIGLAISAQGLGLLYNAAQGDRSLHERQGAILENRAGGSHGLPVIYGKTRIGPILADVRIHTNSTESKRLVICCSFAHGSADGTDIQAIDEIWLNDQLAWNGAVQAPFSDPIDDPSDSEQTAHLKVITHLGADSQVVDPTLALMFPTEWPSTAKGQGVAYVILLLWYNQQIFGSGMPRINIVARGQKLFDPRTSTTAYGTNPALAIRDFLTSSVYGFDEDETAIDDVSFEDAADYCDESVDAGQGPQKRFELGGWVDTNRPIHASLADLTTACRCTVINVGGLWKIIIRRAKSVTGLVLTPTNTVEGSWKYILPGSHDARNSIECSYIDPGRDYQIDSVLFPEPGQTNPHLIDDSAQLNETSLDLPFTDNRLRAQQIGMVVLRESREAIAVLLSAKEEFLQAEPGDLVEITHPSPGWVLKPFWVVATNYRPHPGVVDMILVEYEPTVYDLETQFPQPTISDTNLPDPFTVAPPTSLVLTGDNTVALIQPDGSRLARIRLAWVLADDAYISHYEVEAKRSTDSVFDAWGRPARTDTEFFIVPVNVAETWDIRIFAINTLGRRSAAATGSVAIVAGLAAPFVQAIVPDVSSVGNVSVNVKTSDALSVKIAHDLTAFPSLATVRAATEIAVDSDGNLQTLLRNIAATETLFIAALAYENADGTGDESVDLYKVKSDQRETTIFGDIDVTDGFSAARNTAAPETGTVVFTADGATAFSNLEDANTNETTYRVTITVDWNKGGTLSFFAFVDLHYSSAATGGTFILAQTVSGDALSGIEELELQATAPLDVDFDLRLTLRYNNPGVDGGKTEVTAHGEDSSPPGVQYKKKGVRVSSTRIVLPVGVNLWQVE